MMVQIHQTTIQDPEQYGFTEGKSCMEPTRTVIDTIRYATSNNKSLVVLSPREWRKTAQALRTSSPQVFEVGEELQQLAIEQFKLWHMVPILGTSGEDNIVNMDSLEYANPLARHAIRSSFNVVGQLFHVNNLGQINIEKLSRNQSRTC